MHPSVLTLFVFFLGWLPLSAHAANLDPQNYRRAFSLLSAGKPEAAYIFTDKGRDQTLNKVLLAAYMAQPGNDVPFSSMARFLKDHPEWPKRRDIIAIAEQKLPKDLTTAQVLDWFNAYPPVSLAGFYRFTEAASQSGQASLLAEAVRTRWIEGTFSPEQLAAFHSHFSPLLGRDLIWARLDRLLWDNETKNATAMFSYADPMMKSVAETRLALASLNNRADRMIESISRDWRRDDGLNYERLRWRVRKNMDTEAIELLMNTPHAATHAHLWWEQRHILIRRLIEQHDTSLAYRLAAEHGAMDAKTIVQAEFIAGWLALRSLQRPEVAAQHFQNLVNAASSPISRARGFYWLGRAQDAAGQSQAAQLAYQDAAVYYFTFYGQLASAKIIANPILQIKDEPAIPSPIKATYLQQPHIDAIKKLAKIDADELATSFFRHAINTADQRAEFVLLINLAHELNKPDWAIQAAKAANQKNIPIAFGAFPVLAHTPPTPPETAFTHAVIRQESLFDPAITSSAGAVGLMQLLPSTAKGVARKHGIPPKRVNLKDPQINVKLGTAYLQEQLNKFDGSLILTLAAYNAGPGRVRQWIKTYGDPRSSNVDAIDWLEVIPVYETRNYIQRIMENLQMYRAILGGGTAKLLIEQDIKR